MWSLSRISLNFERFSARSTFSELVPIKVIPFFARFGVRLLAVWPPTDVTMPLGFSNSAISRIRSSVNSSK